MSALPPESEQRWGVLFIRNEAVVVVSVPRHSLVARPFRRVLFDSNQSSHLATVLQIAPVSRSVPP